MRVLLGATRGRQDTAPFWSGSLPLQPCNRPRLLKASRVPVWFQPYLRFWTGNQDRKGVNPGRSFVRKHPVTRCPIGGWSPALAAAGKVKNQSVLRGTDPAATLQHRVPRRGGHNQRPWDE